MSNIWSKYGAVYGLGALEACTAPCKTSNQEGSTPECPSTVSLQDMWWFCVALSLSPMSKLSLDIIKAKQEFEQVVMKREEAL